MPADLQSHWKPGEAAADGPGHLHREPLHGGRYFWIIERRNSQDRRGIRSRGHDSGHLAQAIGEKRWLDLIPRSQPRSSLADQAQGKPLLLPDSHPSWFVGPRQLDDFSTFEEGVCQITVAVRNLRQRSSYGGSVEVAEGHKEILTHLGASATSRWQGRQ